MLFAPEATSCSQNRTQGWFYRSAALGYTKHKGSGARWVEYIRTEIVFFFSRPHASLSHPSEESSSNLLDLWLWCLFCSHVLVCTEILLLWANKNHQYGAVIRNQYHLGSVDACQTVRYRQPCLLRYSFEYLMRPMDDRLLIKGEGGGGPGTFLMLCFSSSGKSLTEDANDIRTCVCSARYVSKQKKKRCRQLQHRTKRTVCSPCSDVRIS